MKNRVGPVFIISLLTFTAAVMILACMAQGASPLPQMVEMEDDIVPVRVSPGDHGPTEVRAMIRSPSNQNMVFDLTADIEGVRGWTVEAPDSIYLGPFEEKEVMIHVTAPVGSPADTEAELILTAEAETGPSSGEDSVTLVVMPYLDSRIYSKDPYLMDMPAKGSFDLLIENTGNIRAPFSVSSSIHDDVIYPSGSRIMIEPGDQAFTTVRYDMAQVDSGSLSVQLDPVTGDEYGDPLVVEFLLDGDLVHILFERGPFLVLLPGPLEEGSVTVVSLGGPMTNVGLESAEDEGVSLVTGDDMDLSSLDRNHLTFDAMGFDGIRYVEVRAYGYHDGERITSNSLRIRVRGDVDEDTTIPTSTLIYAGGGASALGATLVGTIAYFYSASEVFKYKWLLLTFIPLYSKVHGEKILDHFFRGRLFEYIKEHPGVTYTALKDHFEVNNGTLTYHLHRLEKEELVVHRNVGKYKLFYVDGVRIKGVEIVISSLDRRIIEVISQDPGIPAPRVKSKLSDSRSERTISRHLKQLERKGFITSERRDGRRVLFITGEMERVLMPKRGVVEVSEIQGLDV